MGASSDFEKVSMTAQLTAFMRQYSDIPFAKDVAEFVQAKRAIEKLQEDEPFGVEDILWYAPFFEVRYKSIAETIRKLEFRQVLELASGLSLRGLAMTLQNPELIYVETDLPGISEQKQTLMASILQKENLQRPVHLHQAVANALDADQLQTASQALKPDQPVAIVNEGLIQYLSRNEIEQVAQNVCAILRQCGGVWITPDFVVKREGQSAISEAHRRFRLAIAEETGRTLFEEAFESNEQMLAFFERMGLQAECLNQVEEAPRLSSVAGLNSVNQMIWQRLQSHINFWILRLKEPNQG